jgi:dienelactone hydrolase
LVPKEAGSATKASASRGQALMNRRTTFLLSVLMLMVARPDSQPTAASGGASVSPANGPPPVTADLGSPGPFPVGVAQRTLGTINDDPPQDIDAVVWYPAIVDGVNANPDEALTANPSAAIDGSRSYPLLIFSHTYPNGRPEASSLLLSHLASYGFVVAAIRHDDCSPQACALARRFMQIQSALDYLTVARHDPLFETIDLTRVGLAGWSLGGFATLRLLEGESPFRAGLVMGSPLINAPGTLRPANILKPVMFIAGELDSQVPFRGIEKVYSEIGPTVPHWLVAIPQAGHSFGDHCDPPGATLPCAQLLPQERLSAIVAGEATAFLLRHLADDDRPAPELDPTAVVDGDFRVFSVGP